MRGWCGARVCWLRNRSRDIVPLVQLLLDRAYYVTIQMALTKAIFDEGNLGSAATITAGNDPAIVSRHAFSGGGVPPHECRKHVED